MKKKLFSNSHQRQSNVKKNAQGYQIKRLKRSEEKTMQNGKTFLSFIFLRFSKKENLWPERLPFSLAYPWNE